MHTLRFRPKREDVGIPSAKLSALESQLSFAKASLSYVRDGWFKIEVNSNSETVQKVELILRSMFLLQPIVIETIK